MHFAIWFFAASGVAAVRRVERDRKGIHVNVSKKEILKGISWGPVPLKDNHRKLPHDDFFNDEAESLWGDSGRGDLSIMKEMGANAVRMYGNRPDLPHAEFFKAAEAKQMSVIAGMSDYPYTQMPNNCLTTNLDCYTQVKESYAYNLRNGFLTPDKKYQASLTSFILINEPDLKLGELGSNGQFKALLSAFDGALDAEKEEGVVDPTVKFTMTFSFAVCKNCKESALPGLGQMLKLRTAMKSPYWSVGYHARNDLWSAYQARFENSFNTANPSTDLKPLILDQYNIEFKDLNMPIFIGEYHNPHSTDLKKDLQAAMDLTKEPGTLYKGYSFFEWQVRYDKGGSEMEFGMFGLGKEIGTLRMDGAADDFPIHCLDPVQSWPDDVAAIYGGKVSKSKLC